MKKKRKVRPPHSEETRQKMRDAYRARMEAKKEKIIDTEPTIFKAVPVPFERHNRDILQEAVDWVNLVK